PMGFYAPAQLIADARRHGVDVRPVDVTISEWDCTLEKVGSDTTFHEKVGSDTTFRGTDPNAKAVQEKSYLTLLSPLTPLSLRLGLRLVGGLSEAGAKRVVAARLAAPF